MSNRIAHNKPVVYVVEDDDNFRRALVWLLESVGHRVKTFTSAEEFLDVVGPDMYGCLLTDMRLQRKSGLDLLEEVNALSDTITVIVVTAYGSVRTGVRAIKSGALDFIEKPFDEQQFLELVNKAVEMAERNKNRMDERGNLTKGLALLSKRERSVLAEVMAGRVNSQIAQSLKIGIKTVDSYRSRILGKMGFRRMSDLRVALVKNELFSSTGQIKKV